MPEFTNPFSGLEPGRKISLRELTRGLRLSLAAEEEAVYIYEALADATDHPLAKEVLQDIANEERTHAGEFQKLLNILLEDEVPLMQEGYEEVEEMAEKLGGAESAKQAPKEPEEKDIPTVGDMKE